MLVSCGLAPKPRRAMRNPITRTNKQKKPQLLKTCSLNFFPSKNQDPLLARDRRCFQPLDHLWPPNVPTSWRSLGHVDWSLLTFPWQQPFGILSRQTQWHLVQFKLFGTFWALRYLGMWVSQQDRPLHLLTRRRSHKTWKHVDLSLLSFPLRRSSPFSARPYLGASSPLYGARNR